MNFGNSAEVRDNSRRDPMKRVKLAVPRDDGETQFQMLAECAHFHYDFVDFGELKLTLDEGADVLSEQWFNIIVSCNTKWWMIHRKYESLCELDKQLHLCVYDRKFSMLPELSVALIEKEGSMTLKKISSYLNRLSALADNLIYCGPILCWMEMDNHGNHLVTTDDAAVNIPAIGAAHVVRRYVAQSPDEISFEVGDILSIIDKPPSDESTWWRGKKGFQVGYFPSDCIELIETSKIPPSVATAAPPPSAKPVLNKQGKMMSFLNGYFSSRPNRSQLKQTGIVKERVFGCDLGEHLLNSGQDVPLVLKCCAKVLEKHGIIDGIYRLCGITSNIQKLRNEFDENRVPDLTAQLYVEDVCSISSLVKMYFRDLPNPLLTYQLYDKFISAIDSDSFNTNLRRMREVVRQLPPPHFRTAKFLFKHLSQMASYHSETSMSCKNLAIVWAPNLLRSKDLDIKSNVAVLKDTGFQSDVTEFLIASADEIFDETSDSSASLTWPKSVSRLSSGRKLLTLEEAQRRELGSVSAKQQKCVSAYDCSATSSTPIYHTVIDLPKDRKKNTRRSAIFDLCSSFARSSFVALPNSISSRVCLPKSNFLKSDALDFGRDSTSFNTLPSVHSSVCVNEQTMLPVEEQCQPSQSENEPKVLRSSFQKGSHIPSSSLSVSSTEFDTISDYPKQRQMSSGISVGSFGSVDTCLDENYFKTVVSSKFIQLDSDYHDRVNSLPESYSRQSVSNFKPDPCPKLTEKQKDSQVHNSDFELYTTPSIQHDLCENVKSCVLFSPSHRTIQLVSDEEEFLLLAHSEFTEGRELHHASSLVAGHVMPNDDYALSAGDDDLILRSERNESLGAYESCQAFSETFPATCENSEAKFMPLCSDGSNSNLHSKKFFILEDTNQECRKVLRRHSFTADSFKTCGNKLYLGLPTDDGDAGFSSSASSSLKCAVSCEEIYCKFNQMSSLTEDQFSSVVNHESEPVEILEDGLTKNNNSRSESVEILEDLTKYSNSRNEGNEKETCLASVGDDKVNGQESSQCLETSGDEQDPERVHDLNFTNEETSPYLTSTDILIDKRYQNCKRLDTVGPLFCVDTSVAVLWNKTNLTLPLGSESPECPSFLFDCASVSEGDVSDHLVIYPHTPLSSIPSVSARNSIEGDAELKSTKFSENPLPCPECLLKCHNLQEESELSPDNVLLDSIDVSGGPLHSECASDNLIESVPVEEYEQSEYDNTSIVAEKDAFSPLVSVSSASSSCSDLRPSVSDLSEAEMCDQAMSASTFGLTADAADQHEKEPKKREIDRPLPTSAFELVSKPENLFCGLESANTLSTGCLVYAEIRTRSSRWSDPPDSIERLNISCMKRVSFPFCSSDVKHRKHHSGTNFGYFKENNNIFWKGSLNSSSTGS